MNAKKSNDSSNGNGHRISVMLVDDDLAFLRITKAVLLAHYRGQVDIVGIACSGEECLKLAQIYVPQVVVMDLDLPEKSGLQTISLLHLLLPETRIIALTFEDQDQLRRVVLALGGSDLISKVEWETYLFPAIDWALTHELPDLFTLPVTA